MSVHKYLQVFTIVISVTITPSSSAIILNSRDSVLLLYTFAYIIYRCTPLYTSFTTTKQFVYNILTTVSIWRRSVTVLRNYDDSYRDCES